MRRLLIFTALASLTACSLQEKDVAGYWQAVSFFENGKTVTANNLDLDAVSLRLTPDGGYEFHSQGSYYETGRYRVSVKYLFLTDTTRTPAKEHVVKVLHLSADTLKIQMSQDNKEQVLFLARKER